METLNYNPKCWREKCPKHECHKDKCKCGIKYVNIPAILGDDSASSSVAPKKGAYCNAIVKYEINNHIYVYSCEGIPTFLEANVPTSIETRLHNLEVEVEQLRSAILGKQDILTAGEGIAIEDNVISSTVVASNAIMPVTLSAGEPDETLPDDTWPAFWASDYTFEQLAENPSLIRIVDVLYGEGTDWFRRFGPLIPIFAKTDYAGSGDERHPERIRLGFYPAYAKPNNEDIGISIMFWAELLHYPYDDQPYAYIGWITTNVEEENAP